MGDPREMFDYLWLDRVSGSVQLRPHGVAEAGKIYPGPDGHRFFYGTYGPDCIYILVGAKALNAGRLGKVFQQDRATFAGDVGQHGFAGELNLKASKAVIEGFMDIFLGVLSVTSGPVAVGITGMNLLVSAGQLKRDYSVYTKAMEVLLYNRTFIQTNAKMLYNVVMIELLYGTLEKTLTGQAKDALLKAVPGPKVAGKVAGVFLGKIGEDNFKVRLKAINELFKDVLIKVADHASTNYPKKLSDEQVEQLAKHHVLRILNAHGLIPYLDQPTAEKIVREVVDNCLGLRRPLKEMSAALDKV